MKTGRRKNTAKQRLTVDSTDGTPAPSAAYGSFDTRPSRDRGWIIFPTLSTREEVDTASRTQVLTDVRWLYNRSGLVKRIVNGIARMVCGTGLMPEPLTKDKDFNAKLRALYMQRCGSPHTFDLAGRYSSFSAQRAIIRAKRKDGDVLPVLARNADNRLRVAFYESHQIGHGELKDPRWYDGILLGQHNEVLGIGLLGTDAGGRQTVTVVDPANARLVASYERFGQVRGISCLYHAVNTIKDRGEIRYAVTKGIKRSQEHAYVMEQDAGTKNPTGLPGRPGSTTLIETSKGPVTLKKLLGGGEVTPLQPGQTFKILHDERMHPNTAAHLEELVRDIAAGTDYSYEVLWRIDQLGGANTRFIMADAASAVAVEQDELVEQFLGPHYIAWTRDMIRAGEIEEPKDADGKPDPLWFLHSWLADARLTVDFGRDGNLHIGQWERGLITMKTLYGFTGLQWQTEIDQYLNERQYVVQGIIDRTITERDGTVRSMTSAEAFPRLMVQQLPAVPESEDGLGGKEEDEEEDPPKKKEDPKPEPPKKKKKDQP